MKIVLPFHSYELQSRQAASRRLVNCYAESMPPQGKSPLALMRSPGIRTWATLPSGITRGMAVHAGVLYVVCGTQLYSVSSTATVTALGSIPGTGAVSMASNGAQLIIVAQPRGYTYNGTVLEITDADFTDRGASQVAVIDSFALFVEPESGRFFGSEFMDATSYDGLAFATAEGAPDDTVAILVDHRQVFLFGENTTEVWYNAGGDPVFPFLRETNGFMEVGCAAPRSPVKADNAVFWLDDKRIARRLVDYVPTRISTHAIEQKWQLYDTVSDAYSLAFMHEGHWFWCMIFPAEGETWLYDIATGEWHERQSRQTTGDDGAWRVAAHAHVYGMNIVADTATATLGVVDGETYTEWGNPLRMEWTYPSIYTDGRRAFHHRLQIDFEAGVGLTTGQGADPQVMLYASDDGGQTFKAVPNRYIGKIGEYRRRVTWHRLGSSRDRVYRAAVSDPVRVTVWDTQAEIEGGRL